MLIFTRNKGKAFMVGKDIKITVLEIRDRQVRIGISAPKEIDVHREEIFNKIHRIKLRQPSNDYLLKDQAK